MNEMLLQYIWDQQLFNLGLLQTTRNEKIKVHMPGQWNRDQGPDFLAARIEIGEHILAGHVEIHVNSSEWEQHGHQHDPNYNNVVLHVVWKDDQKLISPLPVAELHQLVPSYIIKKYSDWMWRKQLIPCSDEIGHVAQSHTRSFFRWMTEQRYSRRADQVINRVQELGMDWEEAFWQAVSRSFGYKVNAEAFENIASAIPYKIVLKLRSQLMPLEALLLGQAGLLRADTNDDYAKELFREYAFLKKKYGLARSYIPVHFLRMRPINFPTVRLAQLARLVFELPDLFRKVKEMKDPVTLKKMLKLEAGKYWDDHYRFNELSVPRKKVIGEQLINSLIANTILPFILAYNKHTGNRQMEENAMSWLDQLDGDNNSIIREFEKAGVIPANMNDTQGMLELHKQYCSKSRCSECAIGQLLLKKYPVSTVINMIGQ